MLTTCTGGPIKELPRLPEDEDFDVASCFQPWNPMERTATSCDKMRSKLTKKPSQKGKSLLSASSSIADSVANESTTSDTTQKSWRLDVEKNLYIKKAMEGKWVHEDAPGYASSVRTETPEQERKELEEWETWWLKTQQRKRARSTSRNRSRDHLPKVY